MPDTRAGPDVPLPGPSDPDRRLLAGLQRGTAEAVEALVERWAPPVFRVARRLLDDKGDAEAVTGRVLQAVIQKSPTFQDGASLRGWIYGLALAVTLTGQCPEARPATPALQEPEPVTPPVPDVPVADWSRHLDDVATRAQAAVVLERSLRRLSRERRVVAVLCDVERLSSGEVAAILGVPVATVKARLHQARLALRAELTQGLAGIAPTTSGPGSRTARRTASRIGSSGAKATTGTSVSTG